MTLEEDQAEMRARMRALKSARRKSRAGTRLATKILQTPSGESASPAVPTAAKSDSRNAVVNSPASGRCETCGRPTSNPRFCSRSCAAVSNNAASPKRKPEGECQRCRTVVSRRAGSRMHSFGAVRDWCQWPFHVGPKRRGRHFDNGLRLHLRACDRSTKTEGSRYCGVVSIRKNSAPPPGATAVLCIVQDGDRELCPERL